MAILESLKMKAAGLVSSAKFRLAAFGVTSMTLVQYASAASINESVSPILTDVAELFTPLLALILAAIPLIIAISVIGFVMGILAAILAKLHV